MILFQENLVVLYFEEFDKEEKCVTLNLKREFEVNRQSLGKSLKRKFFF